MQMEERDVSISCQSASAPDGRQHGATSRGSLLGPSARAKAVKSFMVMKVLTRALELEAQGRKIIHLEVGQPKTGAPSKVIEASRSFLDTNVLGYTSGAGITTLRQRISQHYKEKYGVEVPVDRVVVATGSSGAFPLVFLAAFDVGDKVAVASSSYPCYRNVMDALGCDVVTIPVDSQFKVTAKAVARVVDSLSQQDAVETAAAEVATEGSATRAESDVTPTKRCPLKGIVLSSPSNPTGAMLSAEEIQEMAEFCDQRGIVFISDEIYHGISYGKKCQTALAYSDQCFVINSFSKYYSMTGWRLGWMVVPEHMVEVVSDLSTNFFISAPTLSQLAAGVAAFDCDEELLQHVEMYSRNRSILLKGLSEMGFTNVSPSDGAFYIYVDVSDMVEDSSVMAHDLLEDAGVAVTPGIDFEDPTSDARNHRVRFSYCRATEEIEEGMARMRDWWAGYDKRKG